MAGVGYAPKLAIAAVCAALLMPAMLHAQTTVRASVSSSGAQATGASGQPSMSADGRFVAFDSLASNLVENDANARSDVFVRDLMAGTTTRVSIDPSGQPFLLGADSPAISADGRYVAFRATVRQMAEGGGFDVAMIYVRDLKANITDEVGPGYRARISAGGRFVAFESNSTGLIPPEALYEQIFVRDRLAQTTTLISPLTTVNAFDHWACQRDPQNCPPEPYPTLSNGLSMSADGRHYLFLSSNGPGRTDFRRVYAFDRITGVTTLVADERYYECDPTLFSVFHAYSPGLSASGRHVAFGSNQGRFPCFPEFDHRITVQDRLDDSRIFLPVPAGDEDLPGVPQLVNVKSLSVSGDGRFVAIQSSEAGLVPDDSNGVRDVFLFDRQTGQAHRVSVASDGSEGIGGQSRNPSLSASGRSIAFESAASNLVGDDTNALTDVFVHEWLPPGGGDAVPCVFDVSLPPASVPATGAMVTLTVTAPSGCTWQAESGSPWISASPSSGGTVTLAVTANTAGERMGLVDLAGHVVRIRQAGVPCSISAQPGVLSFGVAGGTAAVAVSAPSTCQWSASYASWVQVTGAPHAGNGTLTYTVAPNAGPPRQVMLGIMPFGQGSGASLRIDQAGLNSAPVVAGPIADVTVDQDAPDSMIALAGVFTDPDLPTGDALSFSVATNTNPALVASTATGGTLRLAFTPGRSGTAALTVRATDRAGLSAVTSFAVNVQPRVPGAPGPPNDFRATSAGNTVFMQWQGPAIGTATGYILEVGITPTTFSLATLPLGNVLTFSAAAPSGTYYLRLRARNSIGVSAPTPTVRLDVGCSAPPGPPTALFATVTGGHVQVQWEAAQGPVERYLLEAGSAAGTRDIAVLPLPPTSMTFGTGAPPGRYYLRARAANACGASAPSSEIFIVVGSPATIPGAPPGLTASVNGSTVHLSWGSPTVGSAATGYVLEAGTGPGLANAARLALGPVGALTVPAVPAGSYHVRLRAMNAAGIGPPGPDLVVTVP